MSNENKGVAQDEYVYGVDSPEVVAYREIFPDLTEEAAIGSVVSMRNALINGGEIAPAGDHKEAVDNVIALIKQTLPTPEVPVEDTPAETPAEETPAEAPAEEAPAEEPSAEAPAAE